MIITFSDNQRTVSQVFAYQLVSMPWTTEELKKEEEAAAYFQWRSHYDDKICLQHVLQVEVEPLGQFLTKEHNVWFHNALRQARS